MRNTDKERGSMEMFCFGLMGGMILAVIFVAGGAVYASRDTQRTNDMDSDIRVYVPCRDRNRSGNQRDNQQVEEVIDVLNTMRVGASSEEKAALDYSKECIDIAHKLAKYFKG
jgi:hypothetical protein